MQITIRDTILDGNMGEGWADNYAAAPAMAARMTSSSVMAGRPEPAPVPPERQRAARGSRPSPRR